MPWWMIVPIAAAAGWMFPLPAGKSFGIAFLTGALLWYVNAFILNTANEGILLAKISLLFQGLKPWLILIVTGVLGGLLAGFGALTGRFARDIFVSSKPKQQV